MVLFCWNAIYNITLQCTLHLKCILQQRNIIKTRLHWMHLCICTCTVSSCCSGGSGFLYFGSQWTGQWALVWTSLFFTYLLVNHCTQSGNHQTGQCPPSNSYSQNWSTQRHWILLKLLNFKETQFSKHNIMCIFLYSKNNWIGSMALERKAILQSNHHETEVHLTISPTLPQVCPRIFNYSEHSLSQISTIWQIIISKAKQSCLLNQSVGVSGRHCPSHLGPSLQSTSLSRSSSANFCYAFFSPIPPFSFEVC